MIVERREAMDDGAALFLGAAAVDAFEVLETFGPQVGFEILGGVGEFREDEDLAALPVPCRFGEV